MQPKPKYKAYNIHNFRKIPQLLGSPEEHLREIETVAQVLPFRTNNYVVNELINWGKIDDDPVHILNFPRKELLFPAQYKKISAALDKGLPQEEIKKTATEIQKTLNPDPSGQSANVPFLHGQRLNGVQHKYRETVLMFPQAGQTCHAYCTFCFRWPQFGGLTQSRFIAKESAPLVEYLKLHPMVTDLLLTGGDPMIMSASTLSAYLEPFLTKDLPNLQTIRIGTKSLTYWPYRYLSDTDSDDLLRLFERITKSGRNVALMVHVNHPVELSTNAVLEAIRRIRNTGVQIRTQSPVLQHINDKPEVWSELWRKQMELNCIPYYMFVERDTGSKHFFEVPLHRCWQIFRKAYQQVSGLCRTVRGPVMSATPGKVQIIGATEVHGEKLFVLCFIQGRNADWVGKPFFAKYDHTATWLNSLKPAFGEETFFFEHELKDMLSSCMPSTQP